MGRKIIPRSDEIENKIMYYLNTHVISIGEKTLPLKEVIRLSHTYTYVKGKYRTERDCIGELSADYNVYHSSHYDILPNDFMCVKNKTTLRIPRSQKELEHFSDIINMYLKADSIIEEKPRTQYKRRRKNNVLISIIKESNIWEYAYHWDGKQTRGAFYKSAWSFESDCDVYENLSRNEIAKIRRRAGRGYEENNSWDSNYSKRLEYKRYKNVLSKEKKLT